MSKAGMMCDCEYNCQTNNDQELKHNYSLCGLNFDLVQSFLSFHHNSNNCKYSHYKPVILYIIIVLTAENMSGRV